jgi:hypothetical protein
MSARTESSPSSISGYSGGYPATPQPSSNSSWDPDEQDINRYEQALTYNATAENLENIKMLIAIYRHRILALARDDKLKIPPSYDRLRLLLETAAYLSVGEERKRQFTTTMMQNCQASRRRDRREVARLQGKMERLKEVMRFRNQPVLFREKMQELVVHFGKREAEGRDPALSALTRP